MAYDFTVVKNTEVLRMFVSIVPVILFHKNPTTKQLVCEKTKIRPLRMSLLDACTRIISYASGCYSHLTRFDKEDDRR